MGGYLWNVHEEREEFAWETNQWLVAPVLFTTTEMELQMQLNSEHYESRLRIPSDEDCEAYR